MRDLGILKEIREILGIDSKKVEFVELDSYLELDLIYYSCDKMGNVIGISISEIRNNKITDYSFLKDLINLRSIDLSSNPMIDFSFLKELKELTSLKLRNNLLSDISFLNELTNLTTLNLRINQISEISVLKDLKNLKDLDLSYNQLEDASVLEELTKLNSLELTFNKLTDVSFLEKLENLNSLYLTSNNISDVSFLEKLEKLRIIFLGENKISKISFLKELKHLTQVMLNSNKIIEIPEWLTEFGLKVEIEPILFGAELIDMIYLYDNKIDKPPIEIVKQGNDAIRNWFKANKQGSIINNEGKCILLGNSNAGKTTISYQLMENKFLEQHESTHGIIIKEWIIGKEDFPLNLEEKISNSIRDFEKENFNGANVESPESINITLWDFGGQEYYHATHRLFMSSNVLYLLIWEEKTNMQNVEKGEYPVLYWEKIVNYFSSQNIILNIQNKSIGKTQSTDGKFLFKIILRDELNPKSIQNYDLDINDLKKGILNQLANLSYIGMPFPKVYNDIRRALIQQKDNYLVFEEYQKLCRDSDQTSDKIMNDVSQIQTLTNFLDDTGAIICFRYRENIQSEDLKNYVFSKPQWLTDVIYSILERGKDSFDKEHVKSVTLKFGLETDQWIEIMKQFELIFELEKNEKPYIVPQYLDTICKDPKTLNMALKGRDMKLSFALHYPNFLPVTNFLRFISNYGSLSEDNLFWKNGIVFFVRDRAVYAECNYDERKISVKIQDKNETITKDLFSALLKIDNAEDLQISVNGSEFVEKKNLEKYINTDNHKIDSTSGVLLNLSEFMMLFEKKVIEPPKPTKNVFISYSHAQTDEFKVFQRDFKNYLRSKEFNFDIFEDFQIPLGAKWDKYLQNKVKGCHVIILLVSQEFMNSEYIKKNEFGKAMERLKSGSQILISPVYFAPCPFKNEEDLRDLQFFKPDGKDYGEKTLGDRFTYCDLVKFDEKAGALIPNNYRRHYMNDYIDKLLKEIEKS